MKNLILVTEQRLQHHAQFFSQENANCLSNSKKVNENQQCCAQLTFHCMDRTIQWKAVQ